VALYHHIDLRVLWSDTDPAGIVWYGVFFRYFENAEEERTGGSAAIERSCCAR
jgi:acyl-CoA thioesterase FadM